MSGNSSLPAAISVTENVAGPRVSIAPAPALPPGLPAYPLAAFPGQVWDLQIVNGVLTWVQFTAPPGETAWGLEDGAGAWLLEDGAGVLLLEA
jgi:hypothetical protein